MTCSSMLLKGKGFLLQPEMTWRSLRQKLRETGAHFLPSLLSGFILASSKRDEAIADDVRHGLGGVSTVASIPPLKHILNDILQGSTHIQRQRFFSKRIGCELAPSNKWPRTHFSFATSYKWIDQKAPGTRPIARLQTTVSVLYRLAYEILCPDF